jgi:hypothetical protein
MPKPEIDPRLPIDCKLCIKTPKERLLCDTLISVREELVLVLPCVQVERVKERVIKSQSERQLPARNSSDKSPHSGARNGSTPGVHIFSKEE